MSWFRRRAGAVADLRAVAGCWRRGDLAVCISGVFVFPHRFDPRTGDVLRVSAVVDTIGVCGRRSFFLRFGGKPADHGWCGSAFRKVVQSHEPAEAEFTSLIRKSGGQPSLPPVPADPTAVPAAVGSSPLHNQETARG